MGLLGIAIVILAIYVVYATLFIYADYERYDNKWELLGRCLASMMSGTFFILVIGVIMTVVVGALYGAMWLVMYV